jgi:hypothetical protein
MQRAGMCRGRLTNNMGGREDFGDVVLGQGKGRAGVGYGCG